MRFRYFLIIGIVLFIVSLITIAGLYYIQMNERKESIDSRLYETAQILLSSNIIDSPQIDMEKAKKILEYEIGKGQSENFFLVRNESGRILYKYNIQASEFEYIPLADPWHTVNHPEKYIRVLSVNLSQQTGRSLQVGIIVSKDLVIPQFFSKITWLTILLTNLAGILIAWFLANFLTRPIRHLSDFLNQNAQIENGHFSIKKISSPELQPKKNSRDEFDVLIITINQLIERVNQGFQISRLWTYQMSHEIKTPLSIVSSILNQPNSIETLTEKIRLQIFKISETVNAFLSWAEAQNIRPNVTHVIRISRLLNDVIEKVKIKINVEIVLELEHDFIVGINYNQMEQVFSNLLVNAFDHGKKGSAIRIVCRQNAVTVFNQGEPFPQRILDNLGQPFNKGDSPDTGLLRGTGLGLAYVTTVCQMNEYLLDIQHADGITSIRLDLSSAIS